MSTTHLLALGPEMTMPVAAAVRGQLVEALNRAGPLSLDLGGASDFDSSGIQLLLAARRSLAARGDSLNLHAASAPVRDALAIYGLGDLLKPAKP